MPDSRFFETGSPLTAAEAAAIAGAELAGPGGALIRRAGSVEEEDLFEAAVFVLKAAGFEKLKGKKPGLLLTSYDARASAPENLALALSKDPKRAFARLAAALHAEKQIDAASGVHPSALIGADCIIHSSATIGAGAVIGARTKIDPNAVIGPNVVVGPDSVVGAGAVLVCCLIGERAIIAPGVKIGQQGFGFAPGPDGLFRIPQLGRVVIGDRVEVGANSTIDRGSLGDTTVGNDVKIDNLVHLGHNVNIGRGTVLTAQIGIAGSTTLGEGVIIGGQTGIADHLTIESGAQIAAHSGVMHNIPAGQKWGGYPAKPVREWLREVATLSKVTHQKKKRTDGET